MSQRNAAAAGSGYVGWTVAGWPCGLAAALWCAPTADDSSPGRRND